MARKPRFYAKGIPCHVVQCGNNRQACFYCDDDFGFYMQSLGEALKRYQVELHAFVLMTNHAHLLMTPQDSEGISRVMQSVGRDYVRYINSHYRRTGTLWEGRHKASLIDSEQYLLLCLRYIELNPVRALMVKHPGKYHWSSFQYHGYGKTIKSLTPHPLYLSLGTEAETRREAYKALFSSDIAEKDMRELRQCLKHNYPLGGERFRAQIEHMLGVRLGRQGPGRPMKEY